MIYVASPYSHKNTEIQKDRYRQVSGYVVHLLKQKLWCYSPIVHCHELALTYNLPTDAATWQAYNEHMLIRSDRLYVYCINGWELSKGVNAEIAFWQKWKNSGVDYVPAPALNKLA